MSSDVANYIFGSWARIGAANQLDTQDDFGKNGGSPTQQAQIQVQLSVSGGPQVLVVPMKAYLYGPQHIAGIDRRVILRTTPEEGNDNFEPNYLPAIEFSEVDLPWRYTPLGPSKGALRPWICLIALKGSLKSPGPNDEFTTTPPSSTVPLIQITVNPVMSPKSKATTLPLPLLTESIYWAHVQVAAPKGSDPGQQMHDNLSLARSRLLCPRKLEENTHYTAFLVPVFKMGAKAGRGESVTDQDITTANAWEADGKDAVTLPVYYSWEFTTGPGEDFESLVLQLVPRGPPELSSGIGTRPIDGSDPDPGNSFPPAGDLTLSGAVVSTSANVPAPHEPPPFPAKLLEWLNIAFIRTPPPLVGPPIYGKWYTSVTTLDQSSPPWVYTLNAHPANRMAAGFGSEVVKANRLQLLSAAWAQVKGIQKANQTLRQAQLSREALAQMHAKYIASAPAEKLLLFASPVLDKLLLSPKTAGSVIRQSPIPNGSISTSMRKVTRRLGPIRSRQQEPSPGQPGMISRLNSGDLNPAPPAPPPSSASTIDGVTNSVFPSSVPPFLLQYLPFLWWILLLLIPIVLFFGVLALGLAAFSPALLSVAGILFAAAVAAQQLASSIKPVSSFMSESLTPQTIQAVPSRSGFTLVSGNQPPVPATSGGGQESAVAARFRFASSAVQAVIRPPITSLPTPVPIDIEMIAGRVGSSLDPATTVKERILPNLVLPPNFTRSPGDELEQVVYGPSIPRAMYEPLVKLSTEAFLPGLGQVPQNTVAVFQTNEEFVEAYMVGVNHEMAKLLTFNGYPTDPRYTFFQEFWDKTLTPPPTGQSIPPDIDPVLFWPTNNHLGENGGNPASDKNNLVLFVYGRVLKRYPDTLVFAAKVTDDGGQRKISTDEHQPVFRCSLPPDITLLGFDITKDDVLAPPSGKSDLGFYFIIQQHPSKPRFRFEDPDWGNLVTSDWGYVQVLASGQKGNVPKPATGVNAAWGSSGGDMAAIAYQEPMQVAYKAASFIVPSQGGG